MTDAQGTTKLETNGSQGVTSTQEMDAFRREVSATGSTASPFGYHGAEGYRNDGDNPSGLDPYQKVGARYYDRLTGRFITRDTDLSQSPYSYCGGDPVNCTDPTGHDEQDNQDPNDPDYEHINGGSGSSSTDPGNNPAPQLPPASGGVSIPNGSGGTVTGSPSGNGTVTDTNGPDSIIISGLEGPDPTVTARETYPLAPGITAIGSESYTPGTGASSQTFGLGAVFGSGNLNVTIGSNGSYSAIGGLSFKL